MSAIQHAEARKLLKLFETAIADHEAPLDYRRAAKALGRDPVNNSRRVTQVRGLLDAAAVIAGVPFLALVMVRELSGKVNRKAWTGLGIKAGYRDAIISRSLHHPFTAADFAAIAAALEVLAGKSNSAAWNFVRATVPYDVLYPRLTDLNAAANFDAINDLGTDTPDRVITTGIAYARDPKIREAVKKRAKGKCEFCGTLGFKSVPYLECHHIIALADDGADRMTNVIALCPNDHREAHFGERRAELEEKMIQKVLLLG
jgi:hypothetical protein